MSLDTLSFAGLSGSAWVTLLVLVVMIAALFRNIARPDLIMLGALGLLLLVGVLSPKDAFAGLANDAVLSICGLLVIAAGVQNTGALTWVDRFLFGQRARVPLVVGRLMLTSATISAFMNNTPLVAMLIPRIQSFCQRTGVSPSKLMMPLSTAAVLGGCVTLIGTSTNLTVAGLMAGGGFEPLGFFDQTLPGLAACLVGILYFMFIGQRMLPDRKGSQSFDREIAEALFEVRVVEGGPLVGKTIEEAGLRDLGGAYLAHLRRGEHLVPASPEEILQARDVLAFVGSSSLQAALLERPGLKREMEPIEQRTYFTMPLFEAVLAPSSPLVGTTLKEANFRDTYHGVVLGIHRREAPINGPLGQVPLQAGDLLLIEAREGYDRQWATRRDVFWMVAPHRYKQPKMQEKKAPLALGILVTVITLSAFEVLPLVTAAFCGALLIILTRCLTGPLARRSVDVSLLVIIAASLGLGKALDETGLAEALAGVLQLVTGDLGPFWFLAALYVATSVLTELVSNNAAAALMLPIGLAATASMGLDPQAVGVAVALASSLSFAFPLGYQTNLMVLAPGGYTFGDFFRAGAVLNLLTAVAALAVIYVQYF